MFSEILKYLTSCNICKKRNVAPKIDPLFRIVTNDMPLHTISSNIIGPMSNSNGYKYPLNVSDNASRFL
ncbi:Hypothetical protein SRAE_0000066300 [Strongyloides ratti]|uniref:Integrase zinc-binding domain-containing protein n=1 Tax=Strongyloides ratti TaxID=34506 RepID=A0A090L081_STRRB|nr:Hypothetical protein SRAE_0000066300 [Strongyloides ratti]CEF61542.1 Hypothetical protein SRAE_0000066300 [Strongyloides ratti]